jgi:uncharacterized cupin superfamily protein
MGYVFSSLDELGEGYGFRKIRRGLGVSAFGANALVMAPGYDGFLHYHDAQDELYFVHRGTAFEVGGRCTSCREASSTSSRRPRGSSRTPARTTSVLVIGGKTATSNATVSRRPGAGSRRRTAFSQ